MQQWGFLLVALWPPLRAAAFRLPQDGSESRADGDEPWWEEWQGPGALALHAKGPISPEGWVVPRAKGKVAYFDVHIPKTAGTSWSKDVHKVLPPGEGYWSKESCFRSSPQEWLPGDRHVVFLRKPTAHVYSQFLECKYAIFGRRAVRKPQDRAQLRSLDTWLRFFQEGKRQEDLNCYHPYNMQTRALSCGNASKFASHHFDAGTDISLAMHSLETAYFVGLVEHYQASLCLFFAKVRRGEPLPSYCDCRDKGAWLSFRAWNVTHDIPAYSVKDLSAEEVALADRMTVLDQQLYYAAKRRFVREAAEVESRTGMRILC